MKSLTDLINALVPSQLPEWTVALEGCCEEETNHPSHNDGWCPVIGLWECGCYLKEEMHSFEQQQRPDVEEVVSIFELVR